MTAKQRRELLAQSHTLNAVATIWANDVSDAVVAQVRACLAGRALVKVRVRADSGPACDAAAAELARRVPCELVKRVGRVAVLYRPVES